MIPIRRFGAVLVQYHDGVLSISHTSGYWQGSATQKQAEALCLVLSGHSSRSALSVLRWLKERHPTIPTVWMRPSKGGILDRFWYTNRQTVRKAV